MTKICFASNLLPAMHSGWAGAEVACYRQARILADQGVDLTVLTTRAETIPREEFKIRVVERADDRWGIWGLRLRNLYSFDPFAYKSSLRIFKEIRPRVLHLHNFDSLSFALVASACHLGIPVIYSVYDNWALCPKRTLIDRNGQVCTRFHGLNCFSCHRWKVTETLSIPLRYWIFSFFLRRLATVLVLSESSGQQFMEMGYPAARVRVMPLPLGEYPAVPTPPVNQGPILFVGWVNPHKGLHVLVEAIAAVREKIPQVYMQVVESGVDEFYKSQLLKRIDELGLDCNIAFLGKRPNREVYRLLQGAGVVVVPEQWGIAWPTFLTEAMASARPIVASDIGDIARFVQPGVSGWLADPHQAKDFAAKIIQCYSDPEEAAAMGLQAREHILALCREEQISRGLMGIYEEVLRGIL